MRAIQLIEVGRPVEAREVPTPTPGKGEVLVRVEAAGICASDMHYRAGGPSVGPLPQTLGHEVAGVIEVTGDDVDPSRVGQRVCLHYLEVCRQCEHCDRGHEQFCGSAKMLGKDRDGGYAEHVVIPAWNAIVLPDEVPFEHGAVLMCAGSTSFHALHKADVRAGDHLAIFGVGGLGMFAIQLARAFGVERVFAVDPVRDKLNIAESLGAIPIDATAGDPVAAILEHTGGRGVDASLELYGSPQTTTAGIRCLARHGRCVLVGINPHAFAIDPYRDILAKEAKVIGCSDHTHEELPRLVELARTGTIDVGRTVSETIDLDANAINARLDALETGTSTVRTVIRPGAQARAQAQAQA